MTLVVFGLGSHVLWNASVSYSIISFNTVRRILKTPWVSDII